MYRRGVVSAVDPDRCRARVKLPDRGDFETAWLDVIQQNTLTNRDYALPDVGELVAVLLDEHDEAGCILGAIYTSNNLPTSPGASIRRVTFGDGTFVEYDRAAHELRVSVAGTVTLSATTILLDGPVAVSGGAEAVALSGKVATALNALKAALSGATVVAGDGGASFKAAVVAALAAWPSDVSAEKLTSD